MSTVFKDKPGVRGRATEAAPLHVNPLLKNLTHWLDEAITIPGTGMRVGLDGLLGLIPVVGDFAGLIMAGLMHQEAKRLGLPRRERAAMLASYAFDAILGSVPVVGDLFDFAFKANRKGLHRLQRHVEKMNAGEGTGSPSHQ